MKNCEENRSRIALYVDREITGAEALDIEAHLTDCSKCRRVYDNLRGGVDVVRGASPLYEVPESSYESARRLVARWEWRQQQRRWIPILAAAMVLAAVVGIAWVTSTRSGYESFAALAHRDYARGAFPLDIVSNQPQAVSDWLAPRVPFHLTLPNYPEGGPKRYMLVGARLMQYHGENAAYLAYEMDGKPISLMISSSSRITPSGGERYHSGGLTFYFSSEQGLRIITWKDKGLVYAQVSDVQVEGGESCAICHGGEGERRKFEGLRKRM